MILKVDKKNKFYSRFDPDTGYYERSGVIEDGKDTGVDPFMSSMPELLDIGIMAVQVEGDFDLHRFYTFLQEVPGWKQKII